MPTGFLVTEQQRAAACCDLPSLVAAPKAKPGPEPGHQRRPVRQARWSPCAAARQRAPHARSRQQRQAAGLGKGDAHGVEVPEGRTLREVEGQHRRRALRDEDGLVEGVAGRGRVHQAEQRARAHIDAEGVRCGSPEHILLRREPERQLVAGARHRGERLADGTAGTTEVGGVVARLHGQHAAVPDAVIQRIERRGPTGEISRFKAPVGHQVGLRCARGEQRRSDQAACK